MSKQKKGKNMTTEEKIAVMQAYVDGKKIQAKTFGADNWMDCIVEPSWNWVVYDYRVKPEAKYRPYKDYREMVEDFCERFSESSHEYAMPLIWVKEKETGTIMLLTSFSKDTEAERLNRMFLAFTYLDGSTFGKKAE